MNRLTDPWRAFLVATAIAVACLGGVASAQAEINLSSDAFARLDTFEAHTLTRADRVFNSKEYRRAAAEYDTFILEFPRSSALPYALYRRARSMHLEGKRFAAQKVYQEVLDYFPNHVSFAAASLYYIGETHWENGDITQAMRAWANLADDEDYSREPLAAGAINRLAENLAKLEQIEQATRYYTQVAVDFRTHNPQAAFHALQQAIRHHVRTAPNEPGLRELYRAAHGFGQSPTDVPDDLDQDRTYWRQIQQLVESHGAFEEDQRSLHDRYYRYWTDRMRDLFVDWDDFQITRFDLLRKLERDTDRWVGRLDAQYQRLQQPGQHDRTLRWIALLAEHPEQVQAYYESLDLSELDNARIIRLMQLLFDQVKDEAWAKNTFRRIRFDEMDRASLDGLVQYLWDRDWTLFEEACGHFSDPARRKHWMLRHYHWRYQSGRERTSGVFDAVMTLSDELGGEEDYARDALWKRAEVLQTATRYEDAIRVYRVIDEPPQTAFRMADCYFALGRLNVAVQQLREIENFFKPQAAQAAWLAATYYARAGVQAEQIASLRRVMKIYPDSRESRQAHLELERLGVPMGGGIDAK